MKGRPQLTWKQVIRLDLRALVLKGPFEKDRGTWRAASCQPDRSGGGLRARGD